jgi:hypothetical protein
MIHLAGGSKNPGIPNRPSSLDEMPFS